MSKDIHDQFDRARAYAEQKAEEAAQRLRDGTAKARESASEAYERSREKAGEFYDQARTRAEPARNFVADHPFATAAAAAAAGALVALLFPKGRAAIKALPKVAGALGAQALSAAERAKETVEESGIPEKLSEKASEAMATAKSTAAQAADAARDLIRRATDKG